MTNEYEAGYHDGAINYELDHCPACKNISDLQDALDENAKLRELARNLHAAYVGTLNECEGIDATLIWETCEMVDVELSKAHARFEADRHRFDATMHELGI